MFSIRNRHLWMSAGLFALMIRVDIAEAQLTDITQTPNVENAGIVKSLQQQIGAGVGNIMTPGSSTFIMARDPARAVRRGQVDVVPAADGGPPRHHEDVVVGEVVRGHGVVEEAHDR